jgi:acetolactate decarboxylase
MSELEFLNALHVQVLRHREVRPEAHHHELFQTSTIEALLGGAFDGDVSISEILEHGDLGLGTLNGLDGELIVVDGQAWKADPNATLVRVPASSRTPYAVVVPFSSDAPIVLRGPVRFADLEGAIGHHLKGTTSPVAARIDGTFHSVRVRSVPRQRRPYPPLAEALAQQRISDLSDVSGTMVGFGFPNALEGIEMIGWHLHFVTDERTHGGHVLGFVLRDGVALLDDATALHVELPPAVDTHHGAVVDQDALRRLETDP